MTTSDPSVGGVGLNRVPSAQSFLDAAGLPDPELLARLANEMFRGVSGSGGVGEEYLKGAPAQVPADFSPGVSALVLPAGPAIDQALAAVGPSTSASPLHDQLRSLPATLANPPVPSAAPLTAASALGSASALSHPVSSPTGMASPNTLAAPGIPGGFSLGSLATDPAFGFLQEIRSIVSVPASIATQNAPAGPVNALAAPAPSTIGPLPASAPAAALPRGDLAAPQVAGAAVPASPDVILQKSTALGFLDIAKPLEAVGGVPTVEPLPAELKSNNLTSLSAGQFDVQAIRRDFPILQERVNGRPLIWLDNAATTQKPQAVIDRVAYFYAHENSNIHRAAHTLAARATDAYEAAREKVRRFLNASSSGEIIFVRGATEAINLMAQSWGRRNVRKDDEIVITWLEHHANIVPWQMLCAEKGARLRVAPVDDTGQVILDEYEKLLGPKTRLVSIAQVSNALGTVTPVREMVAAAHRHGAKVLVDGAQAVSHMAVDVQSIDCDFYVFSGHKIFAPTGIGVVYGKADVLESTPPWQGGGNMIADVTFEKTVYQPPPFRFEAGTGNIADAVGLGAALDYVGRIGMPNIARYEHDLLVYATEALKRIPGLRLIGTAAEKASVLSFVLDGYRTEDVGAALSREGIAVRSGHHCAQPILRRFGVESTVRPSLAFYNTCEEIDALAAAVWNLKSGRIVGVI